MTVSTEFQSISDRRQVAIDNVVETIHDIIATMGVSPKSLESIRDELYGLAAQTKLFPISDFPVPTDGDTTRRYMISVDPDQTFALYMNRVMPGHYSRPHNHTTWAVITAVEGNEVNQFFRRTDDGSVPGKATIKFDREVVVRPNVGVTLMPDDIHSIENQGAVPTMHLHMYGRSLETLTERIGFDMNQGTYERFKTPSKTISL